MLNVLKQICHEQVDASGEPGSCEGCIFHEQVDASGEPGSKNSLDIIVIIVAAGCCPAAARKQLFLSAHKLNGNVDSGA